MNKLNVDMSTLIDLSNKVKTENDKLAKIISNIKKISINYQDMMISDAGELFNQVMIREQDQEYQKIIMFNKDIADNLTSIANVYDDIHDKMGGLVR